MEREPVSRGDFHRARTALTLAAALVLLAALPYLVGGVGRKFIALDDGTYIYNNVHIREGLTVRTALWALRSTEQSNWYPLRRLSHLVDVSLFGLDARAHHLVSLGWHVAAALLLFAAANLLTGMQWRSFFVAALFAAHPVQVESVSWAAQRSNVLSGFFFTLTILLWTRYARRPGAGRYGAATAACVLGLLAKPVLVTLPLVLLLLDYWPLGRMRFADFASPRSAGIPVRRCLMEKVPLLLFAAAVSSVALFAHRQTGALSTLELLPIEFRLGNAAISYVRYLGVMIWPANLAAYYPHPGRNLSWVAVLAASLLLSADTALALSQVRHRPWLGVGWLWCAGMLVPMIGIVQFGSHAMADRFLYLPSIGFFLALVWYVAESTLAWPRRRAILGVFSGATLAALATAAGIQAGYWKDSETLFRRTLTVTKNNWMIQNNLAAILALEGRHAEAAASAREALRVNPGYARAEINLAVSLAALGRHAEAAASYGDAIGHGFDGAEVRYNLAISLAALGRHEESAASYREALRLRPDYSQAYGNLGSSLAAMGRYAEALDSYREALRIQPKSPGDWYNIGLVQVELGRPGEAVASCREALRQRPDYADARACLTQLLGRGGAQ